METDDGLGRRSFVRVVAGASAAALVGCGDGDDVSPDGGGPADGGGLDGGPRPDAARPDGGPADGYFEMLVAHAQHFTSRPYRTAEEVAAGAGGAADPARLGYDASMDAARFTFPPSVGNAEQLRLTHDEVSSGNLFYFWEARWGAGWARDGSVDGIQRHKAFQISSWAGAGGGGLYLEPRVEYSAGSSSGRVGTVNVRTYDQTPPIVVAGGDSLGPQTGTFTIDAETWIRHWVFLDFESQQFSYWVSAAGTGLVQIHDRVFHHLNETLRSFWFEFNSSQTRVGGDEIYIWGRNLAILRDLASYDEAVALGALGAG